MAARKRITDGNNGESNQGTSRGKKTMKGSPQASKSVEQKVQKSPSTNKFTIVIVSVLIAVISVFAYGAIAQYLRSRVNTPFDLDNPLKLSFKPSKWGTLRSGVYFGTKSMTPESLVTGLMWFRNRIESNSIPIRHWCTQNDRLDSYGWQRHDFDNFGVQTIVDQDLKITTKVVFNDDDSWDAKVLVEPRNTETYQSLPMSLVYYVATESVNDTMAVSEENQGTDDKFFVTGTSQSTDFRVTMAVDKAYSQNILYRGYLSTVAEPPLIELKEWILKHLMVMNHGRDRLFVVRNREELSDVPNFIAHQVLFNPPFQLVINYSPQNVPEPSKSNFDEKLEQNVKAFDKKFEDIFHLQRKGLNLKEIEFAKLAVSNMIGSVGYFYGHSKVQSKWTDGYAGYGPLQLLTAVPSRSFFPRGFLWDEGFHNLLITRFKPDLSVQIIRSWFNLMNAEGWIPREVILGNEAEARVPSEFVVQRNVNANPPTLFLTLESMYKLGVMSKDELSELFPRLQAWYNWFNSSQVGPISGTYRWRGRDPNARRELNPKTLTSGLDDYPRATHPTDDEYHVDLRCWMTLASRVMANIASVLGHSSSGDYAATAAFLSNNELLDRLHWCPEMNGYCDYGLHSLKVQLVDVPLPPDSPPGTPSQDMVRKVYEAPVLRHVPEFGYVSLFPLFTQIIEPTSSKLPLLLKSLRDPRRLWSNFGLRSLSLDSSYYQSRNTKDDPPYWRGAIWINMNYLALKSLHHYANTAGPSQDIAAKMYKELRTVVIDNIFKQYEKSGYIWEQYEDKTTGEGKGSHPFTGWSALVVLIMAEEY